MTGLLVAMLACGATSIALAVVRRGGVRRAAVIEPLILESVMLAAMLDVHLRSAGILPAALWAVVLVACAMGSAFADRVRRGGDADRASDHVHAIGTLLVAALLLVIGAADAGSATLNPADPHGHAHGAVAPTNILATVAAGVVVYASVVVASVLRRRLGRMESARRLVSLGGLLAMAGMVVLPSFG